MTDGGRSVQSTGLRIAAEELYWHDVAVDAVHYDESARRLTWRVEVIRWEITSRGDAKSGQLIFEGVQHIEPLYDVVDEPRLNHACSKACTSTSVQRMTQGGFTPGS